MKQNIFLAAIITLIIAACSKEKVMPSNNGNGNTTSKDTVWRIKNVIITNDFGSISDTIKSINYNNVGQITSISGVSRDGYGNGYVNIDNNGNFEINFNWTDSSVNSLIKNSYRYYDNSITEQTIIFNSDSTIKYASYIVDTYMSLTYQNRKPLTLLTKYSSLSSVDYIYNYNNKLDSVTYKNGGKAWIPTTYSNVLNPLLTIRPEIWMAISQTGYVDGGDVLAYLLSSPTIINSFIDSNNITNTIPYTYDKHNNLIKFQVYYDSNFSIQLEWEAVIK